ncbi:hypothetical protein PsorP6_005199 [Peronosclerospora sorghi]|uniref:Uncharacterized protein n=1 Tax=Peronosclerospora sorghi TaxID=230839 RepID=A0ACC0W549_9STRA|nr:hypothetical protein PsorP6_005199 [Peronosclerospora sorghi]
MLGSVAFFTTAPPLATISVQRGLKTALNEVLILFVMGGPLYFLFRIGTKWFYFGQTILAGGAKYCATGRGFVTKHSSFDELYRFYASSHLYTAVEIAWSDVMDDFRLWFKWMRGDGGNPNQSWEAWFEEENAYFATLRPRSKACVTMKGWLFH